MRPTAIFETLGTARFEGYHSGVVEDAALYRRATSYRRFEGIVLDPEYPSKCRELLAQRYHVTSQKASSFTLVFIYQAARRHTKTPLSLVLTYSQFSGMLQNVFSA